MLSFCLFLSVYVLITV